MAIGPDELINRLLRIPSAIGNMNHSPALEAATPQVFESVGKNYGRQVDSDGVVWPPRKDSKPHPLLILTGAMLDASTGGLGSYVRYTRKGSELGVRAEVVPYAVIHQYGLGPPRREYFYLHEEDAQSVFREFRRVAAVEFRKQVLK